MAIFTLMIKNNYNVIGVMSGTSLDGIDLAHCVFTYSDGWTFKILESETFPYPSFWVGKLRDLVTFSMSELRQLDEDYTKFIAQVIGQFIQKHALTNLDAVCSHGHTALHQPENGLTYQ